jgi:hypothetical protein
MKVATDRKVNKPRLTLRKTLKSERDLHPMYRGIVPFLLFFGADNKKVVSLTPEAILGTFASFMNKGGDMNYPLSRIDTAKFRMYLKLHGIEDWTKESHEQGECKAASNNTRSTESKRVQRLDKSIVSVRTVDSRKRVRQ